MLIALLKNLVSNTKQNVIEARSPLTILIMKLCGVTAFDRELRSGQVTVKFCFLGSFCLVFWNCIWWYSAYKSFTEDQTITRAFYSTELKKYGEDYEKITQFIYSIYWAWKVSFNISRNVKMFQELVDIDKALKIMGVRIDYGPQNIVELFLTCVEVVALAGGATTTVVTIWGLGEEVPYHRVLQVVSSDFMALTMAACYCSYLYILTHRFRIVNRILIDIRDHKLFERKSIFFGNTQVISVSAGQKGFQQKDKLNANKINSCSRIYALLYRATNTANREFGLALIPTVFFALSYIILNLFYLMEATSVGLDLKRYLNLLVYIFWSVTNNMALVFLIVYFSEVTVAEAKRTTVIVHDIINAGVSGLVTEEAMRLSLQLMHQTPKFTAAGFVTMDYPVLLDGARYSTTFMGLLLQFLM